MVVHVQEVHGQDGLGLAGEELSPGQTGPAWCGIDAGVMQDLPHGAGSDAMAQADQFALHTPVAPGGVLARHADDELLDRRSGGWTPGSAACGVVPFPRDKLAMPGQHRGPSHREDLRPAAAWQQPGQGSQPRPVGRRVVRPGDLAAQHGVLVAQDQQFDILAQISAHQYDGQTKQAPHQLIQDRKQPHPTMIQDQTAPKEHRSARRIVFPSPTGTKQARSPGPRQSRLRTG